VALKKVKRYLKGTRTMGITYGARENPDTTDNDTNFVKVYSDADWAENTSTSRLTSGYAFLATGNLIAWGSNKQTSVAFFTCEAEYVAAHSAAREITWIRFLLHEIDLSEATATSLSSKDTTQRIPPIPLAMDNQGAIALTNLQVPNRRTRHIDMKYHYLRECIQNGVVKPYFILIIVMVADGFTKAFNTVKFNTFLFLLGLYR
jgi:hypothetical protein